MFEVNAVKETWESIPDDIKQQIKLWSRVTLHTANAIRQYCDGVKKGVISSKSIIGTTSNLRNDIEDLVKYYIYAAEMKRRDKEWSVSLWSLQPSNKLSLFPQTKEKLSPTPHAHTKSEQYVVSFKGLMDSKMEIPAITITDEMAKALYEEMTA